LPAGRSRPWRDVYPDRRTLTLWLAASPPALPPASARLREGGDPVILDCNGDTCGAFTRLAGGPGRRARSTDRRGLAGGPQQCAASRPRAASSRRTASPPRAGASLCRSASGVAAIAGAASGRHRGEAQAGACNRERHARGARRPPPSPRRARISGADARPSSPHGRLGRRRSAPHGHTVPYPMCLVLAYRVVACPRIGCCRPDGCRRIGSHST